MYMQEEWVTEINKRSIGKVIIKWCGNEGTEDNEEQAYLRRLLQHVITFVEKNEEKENWKKVVVSIHNIDGFEYHVIADAGAEQKGQQSQNRPNNKLIIQSKRRYNAYVNEKDEVVVVRQKSNSPCEIM